MAGSGGDDGSGRRGDGDGDDLPLKRSVSVAIPGPGGGRLLSVRRPPDDDELPGLWGLPAASLREGERWPDAARRIGPEKLGVELSLGRMLRQGETEREAYRLRMRLYAAGIRSGEPRVPQARAGVTQYVEWTWARPDRLRPSARRGSLCSRLCLEHVGEAPGGDPGG